MEMTVILSNVTGMERSAIRGLRGDYAGPLVVCPGFDPGIQPALRDRVLPLRYPDRNGAPANICRRRRSARPAPLHKTFIGVRGDVIVLRLIVEENAHVVTALDQRQMVAVARIEHLGRDPAKEM